MSEITKERRRKLKNYWRYAKKFVESAAVRRVETAKPFDTATANLAGRLDRLRLMIHQLAQYAQRNRTERCRHLFSAIAETIRRAERFTNRQEVAIEKHLNTQDPVVEVSVREVCLDILQLEKEFDNLQVKLIRDQAAQLSIDTQAVEFEEVHLGQFRICMLHTAPQAGQDAISAMALTPNPAMGDSEVTHPHVRHEQFCLGEIEELMPEVLQSGRVADAFIMLDRIINNYAEGSAFVEISDWGNGGECHNCGNVCRDEEKCEICGDWACDDCHSEFDCGHGGCSYRCRLSCEFCGNSSCTNCYNGELECCADCVIKCATCGKACNPDEIDKDKPEWLCPECQSSKEADSVKTIQTTEEKGESYAGSLPVPIRGDRSEEGAIASSVAGAGGSSPDQRVFDGYIQPDDAIILATILQEIFSQPETDLLSARVG